MANVNDNDNVKNVTPTNSVKSAKAHTAKSKNVKKDSKKPKKSARKFFKEIGSELKKVSWPTFSKVVKQTGVVIAVVAAFTLVLFGFDRLFSFLYSLLINRVV